MSRTTRRRRREHREAQNAAYEEAATLILAQFGRRHPDAYPAAKLRRLIVADMLSGIHATSAPHLWFMARGVGNIAKAERKSDEVVAQELVAAAEHERPGATL